MSRSSQATDKKVLLAVLGTRPEAIKMCPLINELKSREGADVRVCVTSQHKQLLSDALAAFGVVPDLDLDIMKPSQTLFDVTAEVLEGVRKAILDISPDAVLVHGDTTTAFAASLASFYLDVPVCHVEAGLRTGNLRSPFPEEFNRRAVAIIARTHFAPTQTAKQSLVREGIPEERIFVTGNTVIDAVKQTVRESYTHPLLDGVSDKRVIFLTAHRRENLDRLEGMLNAVKRLSQKYDDTVFIYPVHPNPRVRDVAYGVLDGYERIRLCPPLDVLDCHNIIARSYLVLTDSGGLQEEAAALGIPVLVMRDTTERPEGVAANIARLVGNSEQTVLEGVCDLLDNDDKRQKMSRSPNPYGEGGASKMIADILISDNGVL